jgi:MraZ protein
MLSSDYNVTLDDTGRIALPRRLRDSLKGDKLVLTKGADSCIWLYTAEQWKLQEDVIIKTSNPFSANARLMRQHFIGSMQEIDIDKQGRIVIPQTLRDHADLVKDCIIFGQIEYVEIWARDRYKEYLNASKETFKAGLEELGAKIELKKRDLDNAGYSSHAGTVGGNNTVSRSEGQE